MTDQQTKDLLAAIAEAREASKVRQAQLDAFRKLLEEAESAMVGLQSVTLEIDRESLTWVRDGDGWHVLYRPAGDAAAERLVNAPQRVRLRLAPHLAALVRLAVKEG